MLKTLTYMYIDKALKSDRWLCVGCPCLVCVPKNDVTYSCCIYISILSCMVCPNKLGILSSHESGLYV